MNEEKKTPVKLTLSNRHAMLLKKEPSKRMLERNEEVGGKKSSSTIQKQYKLQREMPKEKHFHSFQKFSEPAMEEEEQERDEEGVHLANERTQKETPASYSMPKKKQKKRSSKYGEVLKQTVKQSVLERTVGQDEHISRGLSVVQKAKNAKFATRTTVQVSKKSIQRAKNLQYTPHWVKRQAKNVQTTFTTIMRVGKAIKALLMSKGFVIGGGIVLLVGLALGAVVSIQSLLPSFTLKSDEATLTENWKYWSELDADSTLSIQNGEGTLMLNDVLSIRENVAIFTNADTVLAFADLKYPSLTLSEKIEPSYFGGKTLKEELGNVHEKMIHVDKQSAKIEELADVFKQQKVFTKSDEEQQKILKEVGQYQSLQELSKPFPEKSTLNVERRFGYEVVDKRKTLLEGIVLQATKGESVHALLGGKVKAGDHSLTIEADKKVVTLENIQPSVKTGEEVKRGNVLGVVSGDDGLIVRYKKHLTSVDFLGTAVNPAFYLPDIQYVQFTHYGYASSGGFDKSLFHFVISTKCNAFKDKADKIIEEAKKAGVSPTLFAAIMIHESAWGTSNAIREQNNPSGQMQGNKIIHFETLDKGIEATGATLHNLVVERKLDTVEKLGSVYCPVGAENDPFGLNKNWVPAIKEFIKTVGGNPNDSLLWNEMGALGDTSVLKEVMGTKVDNGQCYMLTAYYVRKLGGPELKGSGKMNASEIGSDYDWGKYGWQVIFNPKFEQLKAGDVINWSQGGLATTEYGHTGVIASIGQNGQFSTIEQNAERGQIVASYTRNMHSAPIASIVRKIK